MQTACFLLTSSNQMQVLQMQFVQFVHWKCGVHVLPASSVEGLQPDVRNVRGMEGIVSAGELIYLPAAWKKYFLSLF